MLRARGARGAADIGACRALPPRPQRGDGGHPDAGGVELRERRAERGAGGRWLVGDGAAVLHGWIERQWWSPPQRVTESLTGVVMADPVCEAERERDTPVSFDSRVGQLARALERAQRRERVRRWLVVGNLIVMLLLVLLTYGWDAFVVALSFSSLQLMLWGLR